MLKIRNEIRRGFSGGLCYGFVIDFAWRKTMDKRKVLIKLIVDIIGILAVGFSLYRYLTGYDSLAAWQRTAYLAVIVVAIPLVFFVSFTERIIKKYPLDESVLDGEEEDKTEDVTEDEKA